MSFSPSPKFEQAVAAFDDYHKRDPNIEVENGEPYPSELLYARRMSDRLEKYAPEADEVVCLAARCQHIGRWEISRASFPMDRAGYLRWRTEEKLHHARIAGDILRQCGYEEYIIKEVKSLLLKKGLHTNPSTQLLEDVVCLVFIEFYLEDFAGRHEEAKVVDILAKTLRKMSEKAKHAARDLEISDEMRALIGRAAASG